MARYTWATVAASLLLWPVAHTSLLHPVAAALLGAMFLREIGLLRRQVATGGPAQPLRVFHWSITYLTPLFLVLSADVLLRPWL